jgi:hypothetical protein
MATAVLMFSESPRSGGQQDREIGRPAPDDHLQTSHLWVDERVPMAASKIQSDVAPGGKARIRPRIAERNSNR